MSKKETDIELCTQIKTLSNYLQQLLPEEEKIQKSVKEINKATEITNDVLNNGNAFDQVMDPMEHVSASLFRLNDKLSKYLKR